MTTSADLARLAPRTPLEIGTGLVIGLGDVAPLPRARSGVTARAALERVLEQALRRPPCLISFSGGRDSSAVLALAAHVARREGLPLPVPATLVFPDCASSDETEWQELVVTHLGLPEWQRLTFHDELDIVGPVARPVLREQGVLWPFNAYFHVPIMELAAGGTVLSGAFGDEMMSSGWAWLRENLVLQGQTRVLPADVARIAISLAPPRARGAFLQARARRSSAARPVRPTWLRADAFEQLIAAREAITALESLSFRRSVTRTLWRLRSRVIGQSSMETLAAQHDVVYTAPFGHPEFVAALLTERGWRMYRDRTAAVQALAGDLLPAQLLSRPTKAWFDTAFFNVHARAFARSWDGTGVDSAYVDPDELRRGWLDDEEPDARTYLLLQQAWLAQQAR